MRSPAEYSSTHLVDSHASGALSRRVVATYGVAHYGKSLFWYSSEILFAFLLTEITHIPATWMGVVLGAGLLLSAMFEPLLAWRIRHTLGTVAGNARLQL